MADTKYKVKALADDLNIKSKEVIELLVQYGFGKKSTMTTLEANELSIVFEHFTQNNQVDIGEYFKKHDEAKAEKARILEEKKAKDKEEQKKQRDLQNKKKPSSAASQAQAPKRSKADVRVVDTRGTSNVNIAKYDEKLDTFVAESDKVKSGREKIKRKTRNDYPSAKKAAVERIKNQPKHKPKPVKLKITVPDEITVSELASRMKVTAANLIKKLMTMGMMANLNQSIDFDTAYLVADEMGIIVEKEIVITIEEKLFGDEADAEQNLKPRSPVVVVMGHVDHGKTTLLDAIRSTNVTSGEAGGITQHIGAYRVKINENDITFLDTPGHEAFTAMRARGANVTDIAVLVVAADDGIMPQTIEAINHAKAAGVTIIVAINKMDVPGADPERIKQELTNYELVPEEWGGDTICVPVSAKQKTGIDHLLDMIILSAEMLELKANPDRPAKGVVIDAKLDKGRGAVATLLVQNGTLRSGDAVIAGTSVGRVRLMTNDKGDKLDEAGPAVPVEIMGLSEVPNAGDVFNAVADERMARELVSQRKHSEKEEQFNRDAKVNLDDLFNQIGGGVKTLKIIVKADVQGSAEAVKHNLEKLTNDEVKVGVIHSGVGAITENDVMLANASNAIVVGFNVRPDKHAIDIAARDGVDIRTYRVIYECIEEIQSAMKGMLAPKFKEVILGRAEVRQAIHVPNVGMVAGSYVTDGKITRNCSIRVVRDGIVISEDKMSSLKRFKDDVREVAHSYECGIVLERYNDVKVGDIFEAYIMEEIKQ